MEELKKKQREERGQVGRAEIKKYEHIPLDELGVLLTSEQPQKRTIAATLLGKKRITRFIPQLCKGLLDEKSLYARIAISEALGEMGEPAVIPLIALLGRIGNNQETTLPKKYFNKKSFPLARDLAARTLVKIGRPAIPGLVGQIKNCDGFQTQQAIDALGGIVSKTGEAGALPVLLQALADYRNNEVTIWKIIRALSAFKQDGAVEVLLRYLTHTQSAIRWEAARGLGLAGIASGKTVQALQNLLSDQESEVRKAAEKALAQLAVG